MAIKLTLKEARLLLGVIQSKCEIFVTPHAWKDHPERGFTPDEIKDLVRAGKTLMANQSKQAIPNSFVLIGSDEKQRRCELVVLFDQDEATGKYIVVCSAYRRVRK